MATDVRQLTAATLVVKVGGTALPADLELLLGYAMVEDNLNLPDMFYLSFLDHERTVVAKAGLDIGAQVEILVASEKDTAGKKIFSGEVTALEAEFDGTETRTVVRGFDKAHRLYRGRRTRTFQNVTYADVVKTVAAGAGIALGTIDQAPGGPIPVVSQVACSDAELLARLAGEVGYMLVVRDGKVDFKAPPPSSGAPGGRADLSAADPLQLVQGDNLLTFNATVTADSQVKEVQVRSWDVTAKRSIVAVAPAGTTSATVDGATPASLAAKFGGAVFASVDVPYDNQAQAEAAAKALAEQIGGSSAQLEGVARGNPGLRAGQAVTLGLVGRPFDGKYTLTATRHVVDNGEYLTHFSCTGRQERSLQGMTSGGGASAGSPASAVGSPVAGVVSALVTNVKDPDSLGRARVKIERFGEGYETDWLRVAQAGAGGGRGSIMLPEVGDEVLVSFEHGDLRRGYVLGGLYSKVDKPNAVAGGGAVDSTAGKVDKRSFTTRNGHFLLLCDKTGEEYVELATKGSKFSLKLVQDQGGGTVLVASNHTVEIDAKGDITIKSQGKVAVEAVGELSLKGQKVAIEGQMGVEVKGLTVKIEGTTQTEMSGAQTSVKASAMLNLEAGAIAALKGAMVQIN